MLVFARACLLGAAGGSSSCSSDATLPPHQHTCMAKRSARVAVQACRCRAESPVRSAGAAAIAGAGGRKMCVGSDRPCATRRSLTVRIRLTLGLPLVAEEPRERQIWKKGALKHPSFDSVGARRASTRRVGRNGEGQPVDRYSTPGTKALWAVWLHQVFVRSHEAGNWENPYNSPAHSWGKKWDRQFVAEAPGYGR